MSGDSDGFLAGEEPQPARLTAHATGGRADGEEAHGSLPDAVWLGRGLLDWSAVVARIRASIGDHYEGTIPFDEAHALAEKVVRDVRADIEFRSTGESRRLKVPKP